MMGRNSQVNNQRGSPHPFFILVSLLKKNVGSFIETNRDVAWCSWSSLPSSSRMMALGQEALVYFYRAIALA